MDAPPRLQHHCDRQGRNGGDQAASRLPVASARSVPRPASRGGQHRTIGSELLDAHPVRLTAHRRQGRAERAGSGLYGRCPWFSVISSATAPARTTHDGQGLPRRSPLATYSQVRRHIAISVQAVCKTVGSADVGPNPTPATTCENAPLAANSRAGGAFLLCPVVCHIVALQTVVLRCPRTHSGRVWVPPGRSVRTVGCFTDGHGRGPRPRTSHGQGPGGARCAGLAFAAEVSVHVPASAPLPGWFPGAGRQGKGGCGDGQGGGPGERDAGRAGGAGAGRP
jgi:hypothetical protein